MKVFSTVILISLAVLAEAKFEEYTGWKSYIVSASSKDQLQTLAGLELSSKLQFLTRPSLSRKAKVLVTPESQELFLKSLEDNGILYEIQFNDVKAQLELEELERIHQKTIAGARNKKGMSYDEYQNVETINSYLADIASRYPETVQLVIPANSFEGRPIHYLKISTTNFEDESKPVIFIDAGIHGNEWIGPPTVTWAVNKLVENVTEPDLLEKFDWILLPLVNPDGYEYSLTSSGQFWRKTRSTNNHPDSVRCPGVDGNRNYDFVWGSMGITGDVCHPTYEGSHAFSEVETRVVRDIMKENLHRLALYITMHGYGSLILYPWGNNGTMSYNAFGLHVVGVTMAEAIDEHSPSSADKYIVGNAALVLYGAAGAAEDYAHSIGVPWAYTIELPELWDAFQVRVNYIEEVCRETWEGIVAGARRVAELY